jgi:hypothetical protein
MKTITLLLLVLLSCFNSHTQISVRHTVYFATNKDIISQDEQKRLVAFIEGISEEFIQGIEINGHTDSDGGDSFNIRLSQRRVESVQKQLSKIKFTQRGVTEIFHGETQPIDANTSSSGKRNNRRVEIVVELEVLKEVTPPPLPIEADCSYDTTLIFPQGTEVTMNICDYFSIKDCFEFIEYNTGESIRNSDLTTMTSDGNALISGGMFEIKMCKEVKVTVDIPRVVNPCDTTSEFTLWTSPNSSETWSPITGTIDRIRNGGRNFLRTVVKGTTSINLDCLPATPPPKMVVKIPRGFKLTSAKLSTDLPASVIYAKKIKKRKAIFNSICPCSEPLIYLEVENPDGEMQIINYTELNDYDTHEAFGQCKREEVVKKILFFKIRKKSMYRKYSIRKKDFEKKD